MGELAMITTSRSGDVTTGTFNPTLEDKPCSCTSLEESDCNSDSACSWNNSSCSCTSSSEYKLWLSVETGSSIAVTRLEEGTRGAKITAWGENSLGRTDLTAEFNVALDATVPKTPTILRAFIKSATTTDSSTRLTIEVKYTCPENGGAMISGFNFNVGASGETNVGGCSSGAERIFNVVHTMTVNRTTNISVRVQAENDKGKGDFSEAKLALTCGPGEHYTQKDDGSFKCEECEAGKFSALIHTPTCRPCRDGRFCPNRAQTHDSDVCQAGAFCSGLCEVMDCPSTIVEGNVLCPTHCTKVFSCNDPNETTETDCKGGPFMKDFDRVWDYTNNTCNDSSKTTENSCNGVFKRSVTERIWVASCEAQAGLSEICHQQNRLACLEYTHKVQDSEGERKICRMIERDTKDAEKEGKCKAGYFCQSSIQLSKCPDGMYCPGGEIRTRPLDCPEGSYCPTPDAEPQTCSQGSYCKTHSSAAGNSAENCRAGFFCIEGSTGETECPAGKYCPEEMIGAEGYCVDKNSNEEISNVYDSCDSEGTEWKPPVSTKEPESCDIGYYCPTGQTQQQECPDSFYCPTTSNRTYEQDCPAGWICTTNNNSVIRTKCKRGTYCPKASGQERERSMSCPGTYYCSDTSRKNKFPTKCPANFECPDVQSTEANQCESGYYCPLGTSNQAHCPGKYFCAQPNSREVCSEGSFCPLLTDTQLENLSNEERLAKLKERQEEGICPPGFYCENTATKKACNAGKYCVLHANESATNRKNEENCPEGWYCPIPTKPQEPLLCPIGHWCENGNAKTECVAGKFCSGGTNKQNGTQYPKMCPIGYWCSNGSEKSACSAGKYCSEGSTSATLCSAGKYCPNEASKTEIDCEIGMYCPEGSSKETPCAKGFYCASPSKRKLCKYEEPAEGEPQDPFIYDPAEVDSWFCDTGVTSPKKCPKGYYCSSGDSKVACGGTTTAQYCPEASWEFSPCPRGFYCTTPAEKKSCTVQGPIAYSCAEGAYERTKCPAGSYCQDESSIVPCTEGQFCPAGSKAPYSCWHPIATTNETKDRCQCPVSYYAHLGDVDLYEPPVQGYEQFNSAYFQQKYGKPATDMLIEDLSSDETLAISCTMCTTGMNCTKPGLAFMTNDPNMQIHILKGYWQERPYFKLKPATARMRTCKNINGAYTLESNDNDECEATATASTNTTFVEDLTHEACNGGGAWGTCKVGYEGPLCGVCAESYVRGGDEVSCVLCEGGGSSDGATYLFILVCFITFWVSFWYVSRRPPFEEVDASDMDLYDIFNDIDIDGNGVVGLDELFLRLVKKRNG
eukprot:GSMAST32.ASY1.ANO1.954.1 assembled CDS